MKLAWLLGSCVVLSVACGGSETPPTQPSLDPASSSAAPVASAPDATPPADAAPVAEATKPADPAPQGDRRLEDEKMKKTTSGGGSYAVNVVAAAGISADDVAISIHGAQEKNDACYQKLFKAQLSARGKTTYEITISGAGKTKAAKLKGDDLKSADLTKCLDGVIKSVSWSKVTDKAGGKTTVEWAVAGN